MNIGWYPGHMNKARKDITKALKSVDAVLEIVDARLPFSSGNPLLDSLIGNTPRLRILNKADLADSVLTERWLQWFSRHYPYPVQALNRSQTSHIRQLGHQCRKLFGRKDHSFRLMIVGIPNVGKSTLLNIILDRKLAKVGNEPAVTKSRQEVRLGDNLFLVDTPGILWPKFEDPETGYRLAVSGAIKNTAYEFGDIAQWAVGYLIRHYPAAMQQRYALDDITLGDHELLEIIGRRRGCLRRGGVDFNKAGEMLIHDLRSGNLGRITLEMPPSQ